MIEYIPWKLAHRFTLSPPSRFVFLFLSSYLFLVFPFLSQTQYLSGKKHLRTVHEPNASRRRARDEFNTVLSLQNFRPLLAGFFSKPAHFGGCSLSTRIAFFCDPREKRTVILILNETIATETRHDAARRDCRSD